MYAPSATPPPRPPGGYTVADIRPGDPYELSDGELIECHPAGERHNGKVFTAAKLLDADAADHVTACDVGHVLGPNTLRAPDISVGGLDPEHPGWAQKPPLLAVEYADVGQDEDKLETKIGQLLAAGTRYLWVVRLTGIPRVEVYQKQAPKKKTYGLDDVLTAPGVLKNPIPVRALFDEQLADRLTFDKLADRFGHDDNLKVGLLALLAARNISLSEAQRASIQDSHDFEQLSRWLVAAATAITAADLGL
jgi:Uma2 family endonuclease